MKTRVIQNEPDEPPTPVNPRLDPSRDGRRLTLFFGGLLVVYLGWLAILHPALNNEDALDSLGPGLMLAPTVGALLALFLGPGVIQWGKPSWWILAGFLPAIAALLVTSIAASFGAVDFHSDRLAKVLLLAVPMSLTACITAAGEEIGWRGFLWPLLRRRWAFLLSAGVMFVVWWIYHAPITMAGWYGFNGGLPAFSVALAGVVLFVGVLTDRSRSVWPSILTHGSWNALVADYFSTGAKEDGVFTGSKYLLGEFGWLAALSMLTLGALFTWWHFRTPTPSGGSGREPVGYGQIAGTRRPSSS